MLIVKHGNVFDEKIKNRLLSKFEIHSSHQNYLISNLNLIASNYQYNKKLSQELPRVSKINTDLNNLLKKGQDYDKVLNGLDDIPQWLLEEYRIPVDIMMEKNEHTSKPIYLRLIEDVHHMNLIVERIMSCLAPDPGGIKKDYAIERLIFELHGFFKLITGLDVKQTYDDYKNEYKGNFVEFLNILLPLLEIEKKPATLSKLITNSLRMEETSPKIS